MTIKTALMYENEPGITREFFSDEYGSYARIRSSYCGEELWRYRSGNIDTSVKELNSSVENFSKMSEFVTWVHKVKLM